MSKPANLTAVLTAAGVLLFLAPAVPAQSTGSTGSSSQSGQTGTDRDRSDRQGSSSQSGQSSSTQSGDTDQSGTTGRSGQSGSHSGHTGMSGSSSRSTSQSEAGTSSSTSSSQAGTAGASTLGAFDRKFVTETYQGGLAEIELGRLAAEKGSSSQVKDIGQKMVDDHTKANEELKEIASNKGITLPDQPMAKDKSMHDRLSKLSGDEFDRAYLKNMQKDHRKDISMFRRASEQAKDQEIKQFASKTLPTLQEHERMVNQTMASMHGTTGSSTTSDSTSTTGEGRTGTSTGTTTDRGDQSRTGTGDQSRRPPR